MNDITILKLSTMQWTSAITYGVNVLPRQAHSLAIYGLYFIFSNF